MKMKEKSMGKKKQSRNLKGIMTHPKEKKQRHCKPIKNGEKT